MSHSLQTDRSTTYQQEFAADVHAGLRRRQKELPCKYFYDQRGSELFDEICQLDEYYPTRTELSILRSHVEAIARALGPDCLLIEPGSGSSVKTELLLSAMDRPSGYVPIDISGSHLRRSARRLQGRFPDIPIYPVCGDFTAHPRLPSIQATKRAVFFPGSTIGNFEPTSAVALLRQLSSLAEPDCALLLGVDLHKESAVLEPAYNDAHGVTARFNLNLLDRINRELDGEFALETFDHRAFYNSEKRRIEMHLVSQCAQTVRIGSARFAFAAGESIRTEYSHKYSLSEFAQLAQRAGLAVRRVWTDPRDWFSVQLLSAA